MLCWKYFSFSKVLLLLIQIMAHISTQYVEVCALCFETRHVPQINNCHCFYSHRFICNGKLLRCRVYMYNYYSIFVTHWLFVSFKTFSFIVITLLYDFLISYNENLLINTMWLFKQCSTSIYKVPVKKTRWEPK